MTQRAAAASLEWTSFLATILELIEKKETGITGDVVALVGVDGRENNPEYQRLCEAVEHGSVAGLLLMNSATVYLLPVLQTPGIPRVAIWAPLPHAALLGLDFPALIDRACERMLEKGKRIAVVSPHAHNLDAAHATIRRVGLPAGQAVGLARRSGRLRAHHRAALRLAGSHPTRSSSPTTTSSSRWSKAFGGPKCRRGATCTCSPTAIGRDLSAWQMASSTSGSTFARCWSPPRRSSTPSEPTGPFRFASFGPRFKNELMSFAKVESDA